MKYGDMDIQEFHEAVDRVCDRIDVFGTPGVTCENSCPLYKKVCVEMYDVDWNMEEVE